MMTSKNRSLLLDLAKKGIIYYMDSRKKYQPDMGDMPFELSQLKGVFVTITRRDGEFRGSIGYTDPVKQVWEGVLENAINAAFHDTRVSRLNEDELNQIIVEISILDDPKKINYEHAGDLLDKVDQTKGYMIRKGMHSATYLPDAWEHFKEKEDFLENLCIKAGLRAEDWMHQKLSVYELNVETFDDA